MYDAINILFSPHNYSIKIVNIFFFQFFRPLPYDVPYYRLLESSPKTLHKKAKESQEGGKSHHHVESKNVNQKALKVPNHPKSSASDSRLTIEYFQEDDSNAATSDLSKSAPPSNPIQSDSEHSLSPKLSDDVTFIGDVQRTISLTSENPSESFFSADEDLHASRSSSLKTTDVPLVVPKKRFASDLSIVGQNELEGKLSSHRSDYEIHTPEHRSLPTRPQSTAELVNY
jgi:hypothetical protein